MTAQRIDNVKKLMHGGGRKHGTVRVQRFSRRVDLSWNADNSIGIELELTLDQARELANVLAELLDEKRE